MAFGENKNAAAGFKPPHSFIDGFKGFPGMPAVQMWPDSAVYEKAAQYGNPHIKEGDKEELFFRDKTEGTPYIGQGKDNIEDAPVVRHETDASLFGYILLPLDGKFTARKEYKEPCPGLSQFINKKGHGLFQAQEA
jgi:hypothetical protein